jgi:hypothetical protein
MTKNKCHPLPALSVSLLVFTLSFLAACGGTFEVNIERTALPGDVQTLLTTAMPDQGTESTVTVTTTGNMPLYTLTPYLDHWITFSNPAYAISLQHPADWQPMPVSIPEIGETEFTGDNGFFFIYTVDGESTIDDLAMSEAHHIQRPYGSQPIIENLQIQGQEARLILPSADQPAEMNYQAALIVGYPQPMNISGTSWRYLVLCADQPHIRAIAQTLQFSTDPASVETPTLAEPIAWENLPPGVVYSTYDGLWLIDSDEQPVQIHNNPQGIDEQPVQIHNNPQGIISPDGTQLISYDNLQQDAWLIDRIDGAIWNLTRRPDRTECCFQWWPGRPDRALFYSTAGDAEPGYYLSTVNTDGQGYQILDAEHDANTNSGPGHYAPSPDGQTIAYSSGGTGWLYRWGGAETFDPADYGLIVRDGVEIAQPAWSPDGSRLAWIVKGNLAVDGSLRTGVALFDLEARTSQVLHPYKS